MRANVRVHFTLTEVTTKLTTNAFHIPNNAKLVKSESFQRCKIFE